MKKTRWIFASRKDNSRALIHDKQENTLEHEIHVRGYVKLLGEIVYTIYDNACDKDIYNKEYPLWDGAQLER